MKLQQFFYLLVRDEVPFGRVERVVAEVEKTDGLTVKFSEPKMADYAASLAARLAPSQKCIHGRDINASSEADTFCDGCQAITHDTEARVVSRGRGSL